MPLASHTMKPATQSYALRLIAGSVAPPRTDFESCVMGQAVGPREIPCNFCQSVASDWKKRFSTLFGKGRFVWGCPPLPQPAGCNVARGPVPRKGTSPGGQDWRKPSLSVDGSAQSDAKPEESEPNVDRGGLAFGMLLFCTDRLIA